MPNYSLPWDCPENWRKVWGCQAGKEWCWNLWSWTQVMPENKGSKPSLAPQGWSSSHILVSPQQGCLHRWGGHLQQVCLPAPSDWNKATIRWDCLQSLKWSKQTLQTIPPDGCQGGICWRSQPGVFQDAAPQGTFLLQHEISQGLHIPYPKKYTRDQGVHCSPTRVDRYLCQWGLVGPGVDCGKNVGWDLHLTRSSLGFERL